MPHISLPENLPGIIGLMTAYPETAKPLNALAEALLVQDSPTLSKTDREGYVDGLATVCPPRGFAGYADMGQRLTETGYVRALES